MLRSTQLFAVLMATTFAATSHAAELDLTLDNLVPNGGKIYVALYDDAASFMHVDQAIRTLKQVVTDSEAHIQFKDLPNGDYAVAVFQDLNGSARLDSNVSGTPIEPVGLSQNATEPKFEQARLNVTGKVADTIHLRQLTSK